MQELVAASSGVVDSTAHIVQVALTPIFLLTGVGTLLNVFNTRLARVSDHDQQTSELLRQAESEGERKRLFLHRQRLKRRLLALDATIMLLAIAGAATCCSVFILFIGSLKDPSIVSWLVISFGVALVCIIAGLMTFMIDTLLAWHGRRHDGPPPRPAKG